MNRRFFPLALAAVWVVQGAVGRALALGGEGFWETLEDEVEDEFACDGDVETGMGKWSSDYGVL